MPDRDEPTPQHEVDARTLKPMQLRERYKSTYDTWRNMKQRRGSAGAVINPAFERFPDFLVAVGPRPEGYTLDRINHTNPEYGPGLVRWMDDKGQANNRSTTILLTIAGETKPLSIWAEETGQKADTLRARLAKGWSHDEVVYGKVSPQKSYPDPWNYRPWPKDPVKYQKWEDLYQAQGEEDQLPIVFFVRWLQRQIYPELDYLAENDDIPSMADEWLARVRRIEPYQERLEEALIEEREIRSALKRCPRPHGWCGPRRFRQSSY